MTRLLALPAAWFGGGCQPQEAVSITGADFPDIELSDLAGEPCQYRTLRGSPLLLNVWATWCAPCRNEMADLQGIYEALHPRGLQLVGISVDEDLNLVKEYVRRTSIHFPIWSDPLGKTMFRILSSRALPTTILVESTGRIDRIVIGARAWMEGDARRWVESLVY